MDSIFTKIINKEIQSEIQYEEEFEYVELDDSQEERIQRKRYLDDPLPVNTSRFENYSERHSTRTPELSIHKNLVYFGKVLQGLLWSRRRF